MPRLSVSFLIASTLALTLGAVSAGAQVPLQGVPGSPAAPSQPSGGGQQQPSPSDSRPSPAPPPRMLRLSDERTRSEWAHAYDRGVVRAEPDAHARAITRLRYYTEDGYPEVYLALRQYTDDAGNQWVQVRLPMRPNGRVGWVRRGSLGGLRTVTTFLLIDRRHTRATLYRSGRVVFRTRIGVGRPTLPTPAGHFYVRERLRGAPGSLYGPLAFGTSAYSRLTDWPGGGVVGIHGTNEPQLIPGRPSHGCVRMRNRAILKLGRLMPIGTPVEIR